MEQEVEWEWGKVQEKVRRLEAKGKKVEVTVSEQKADQTLQIHPVVARGLITGTMQCPCFASGACEAVR